MVIYALVLAILFFHSLVFAYDPAPAEATKAAEAEFLVFKEDKLNDDFKNIGFSSKEDINKSHLGTPIQVFKLPEDVIFNYKKYKEKDLKNLLIPLDVWNYPIIVGKTPIIWMTIKSFDGQWKWYSTGGNSGIEICSLTEKYKEKKGFELYYVLFPFGYADGFIAVYNKKHLKIRRFNTTLYYLPNSVTMDSDSLTDPLETFNEIAKSRK